jgi:hypothetical protein
MRIHRRRSLLVAAVAATVVSAVAASSASAVLIRLENGQTASYQPLRTAAASGVNTFDSVFGNMDYNGGPLMPSNTDTPTHVYAKPGIYKVIAVLFSGIGSAFPGAGAAPVVTQEIKVS